MLSQNSPLNDEAISQCSRVMDTLVARSAGGFKTNSNNTTLKNTEGEPGGCDYTFLFFFSSRAKEFSFFQVAQLSPAESGQKITERMRGVQ